MKKNPMSHRTQKWIERNDISFPLVEDKVRRLCDSVYLIKNYKIDFINSKEKALWIYKEDKNEEFYYIVFNYKKICLELYQNSKLLNEYNRDDCWLLALQKAKDWSVKM